MPDQAGTQKTTIDAYHSLARWHLQHRPLMQIQDIYKLLYQSLLGAGHMQMSPQAILTRLERELAALPSCDFPERLLESIHPLAHYFRVNLRPYLQMKLAKESLVNILYASFAMTPGGMARFITVWNALKDQPQLTAQLKQLPAEVIDFKISVAENNYPVLHHSSVYRAHYKPAYRVVAKSCLDQTTMKILEAQ